MIKFIFLFTFIFLVIYFYKKYTVKEYLSNSNDIHPNECKLATNTDCSCNHDNLCENKQYKCNAIYICSSPYHWREDPHLILKKCAREKSIHKNCLAKCTSVYEKLLVKYDISGDNQVCNMKQLIESAYDSNIENERYLHPNDQSLLNFVNIMYRIEKDENGIPLGCSNSLDKVECLTSDEDIKCSDNKTIIKGKFVKNCCTDCNYIKSHKLSYYNEYKDYIKFLDKLNAEKCPDNFVLDCSDNNKCISTEWLSNGWKKYINPKYDISSYANLTCHSDIKECGYVILILNSNSHSGWEGNKLLVKINDEWFSEFTLEYDIIPNVIPINSNSNITFEYSSYSDLSNSNIKYSVYDSKSRLLLSRCSEYNSLANGELIIDNNCRKIQTDSTSGYLTLILYDLSGNGWGDAKLKVTFNNDKSDEYSIKYSNGSIFRKKVKIPIKLNDKVDFSFSKSKTLSNNNFIYYVLDEDNNCIIYTNSVFDLYYKPPNFDFLNYSIIDKKEIDKINETTFDKIVYDSIIERKIVKDDWYTLEINGSCKLNYEWLVTGYSDDNKRFIKSIRNNVYNYLPDSIQKISRIFPEYYDTFIFKDNVLYFKTNKIFKFIKIEYQLDLVSIKSLLKKNDILIPGNNTIKVYIEESYDLDSLENIIPFLEFDLNIELSQFTLDKITVKYDGTENIKDKAVPLFNCHR